MGLEAKNLNPKLMMKGYTGYFMVNAFTLILQNLVVWILAYCVHKLKFFLQSFKIGRFIHKIFYYNAVIVVFFLTASEMTLMAFYQF